MFPCEVHHKTLYLKWFINHYHQTDEVTLLFCLLARLHAVDNLVDRSVCLTVLQQQIKCAAHIMPAVAAALSAFISCREEMMGQSPAGADQCNTRDFSGAVQMNTRGSARLIKETGRLQVIPSDHSCAFPLIHHPVKHSISLCQQATEYSSRTTQHSQFSPLASMCPLKWLNPVTVKCLSAKWMEAQQSYSCLHIGMMSSLTLSASYTPSSSNIFSLRGDFAGCKFTTVSTELQWISSKSINIYASILLYKWQHPPSLFAVLPSLITHALSGFLPNSSQTILIFQRYSPLLLSQQSRLFPPTKIHLMLLATDNWV